MCKRNFFLFEKTFTTFNLIYENKLTPKPT